MNSVPTPNYVLTEDFTVYAKFSSNTILPAGTFVRPIEVTWLPKHILELSEHLWFNPQKEIYVYTSAGIIIVPKDIVRKT